VRGELLAWTVRGAGLAVGVAAIYAFITIGLAAHNVLALVFIAILLASALGPVIDWMRAKVGVHRGLAILVVYASFLVLVVAFALVVVPAAIEQVDEVRSALPPFFDRVRQWGAELRGFGLDVTVQALVDDAEALLRPAPPDPDVVVRAGLTLAEIVGSVATVLTIVFFWIVDHARLQRFALAFLPAGRRAGARDTWNEVEDRLGRWVRGQLILMSAMGLATTVAYTILGLPSPILLGLMAGVAEAIPIVGPLLGAVPAVLVAATISPETVLIVAVVYLAVQLTEAHILVPLVMSNTIGLSPLIVIVAVLVGAAAGGFAGALFAVPLTASALVAVERLQARRIPVAQDSAELKAEARARESAAISSGDLAGDHGGSGAPG
jgi:predicted PurR-regulated permease PerM